VTHLAPVAAFAARHLVVEKSVSGERTDVDVRSLDAEEERLHELARMLGGAEITREALEHARRLRQEAAPQA